MEQTTTIGDRIADLMARKGVTAYQLAKELGYSGPQKFYKLVAGDAKPGFDSLSDLLNHYPDLSADWLMRGLGPMLSASAAPVPQPASSTPFHAVTSGRVLAVTVDRTGTENILHIPARAQAGYSHSFDEPAYLQDLTPYSLPLFSNGTFRSFEVEGDSMTPTFGHRDTVICQAVDRWDMLAPGHCYVVVVDGNIWVKRLPRAIKSRREVVELVSDNKAYPIHEISATDIIEVWHVRALLSTNIPASTREVQARMLEVLEALGVEQRQMRRIVEGLAPNDAPSA